MSMNNWQFNLSNWQAVGPVWAISISSVYSHKVNLTYWLKSSLLLGFCFLFVCMVNQTQMYPSSVSPSRQFQRIICNIERLEGGTLEPWITWGTLIGEGIWFEMGTSDLCSYHEFESTSLEAQIHFEWVKET